MPPFAAVMVIHTSENGNESLVVLSRSTFNMPRRWRALTFWFVRHHLRERDRMDILGNSGSNGCVIDKWKVTKWSQPGDVGISSKTWLHNRVRRWSVLSERTQDPCRGLIEFDKARAKSDRLSFCHCFWVFFDSHTSPVNSLLFNWSRDAIAGQKVNDNKTWLEMERPVVGRENEYLVVRWFRIVQFDLSWRSSWYETIRTKTPD
jgi:hypothetical protein